MDPSRSQAVETFTSVTGADVETAEHVLDAHGWDLDRGVTYYLERGSTFTAAPVAPGLEEPVNLATVEPPLSDGPSGVADNEAFTATEPWNMDAEDIDLQQVIAISLSAAGAGGTRTQPDRRGNHSEEAIEVSIDSDSDSERRNGTNDEDIEELRTLAQHRDQRQPREEALLDNFEGRFAQFPAPRPPPVVQPLSPTVAAQRRVREEQDAAYQASLLADRERQEAAHKAAEEAEAAKLAQEQARREAEDAAAAEQAAYEEELALKASNLPSEPPQAAADVVNVVVRFPNGRRVGRRFCKSNAIASLFDYVDVEARPDVKPRTYNLVTQFPRRVIAHDQPGSLDAAGLTHGQSIRDHADPLEGVHVPEFPLECPMCF